MRSICEPDPSLSIQLQSSSLLSSMKKKPAAIRNSKSTLSVFDPFKNRLARDIRNTLSQAFVDALMKLDTSEYQNVARQWFVGNPDETYAGYIKDRLERYTRVFEQISANGINDAKIRVLIIWNQGLFFEVHDFLENLWQQTSNDERQALKGLIQAAGVYIHLQFNHRQAAERLAIKSSERLKKYAYCLSFIDNLNLLIEKLQNLDAVPPLLKHPRL